MRTLRRSPGFTVVVIMSLALGIGEYRDLLGAVPGSGTGRSGSLVLLEERLRGVPGARVATRAQFSPFSGRGWGNGSWRPVLRDDGRSAGQRSRVHSARRCGGSEDRDPDLAASGRTCETAPLERLKEAPATQNQSLTPAASLRWSGFGVLARAAGLGVCRLSERREPCRAARPGRVRKRGRRAGPAARDAARPTTGGRSSSRRSPSSRLPAQTQVEVIFRLL